MHRNNQKEASANNADQKYPEVDKVGQGSRREQYEFSATVIAGCFGGLFIIVIAILIINYIQQHS